MREPHLKHNDLFNITMAALEAAIQGNKHRVCNSGWAGQARPW
jgi:hypothetical protein